MVTWGDAEFGGDSSAVQDRLHHIMHIQASEGAFAAFGADGTVVTWGDAKSGGVNPATGPEDLRFLSSTVCFLGISGFRV